MLALMRSRLRGSSPTDSARASRPIISAAMGISRSPAAVSRVARVDRSRRVVPNSCSSFAIWWLIADWEMKQRCAAREKLPSSPTARK